MSKKQIMIREIRATFIKADQEAIDNDESSISQLSSTIMKICRGATMFVIVMSPFLNIIEINMGSLKGFLSGLTYVLFIVFILTPILYVLIASVALKQEK